MSHMGMSDVTIIHVSATFPTEDATDPVTPSTPGCHVRVVPLRLASTYSLHDLILMEFSDLRYHDNDAFIRFC